MPEKGLAAVLMTGGASRRMGQPKALLNYRGEPLWKHQLRKLEELAPETLLISGSREILLDNPPCEVIFDAAPGQGPLAGLQTVLERTQTSLIVMLAVDMPCMTTGFLRGLLREAGPHGVVPVLDGHYECLAAVYPAGIAPLVDTVLAGEERSFRELMRLAIPAGLINPLPVSGTEREFFRNVNTARDFEDFIACDRTAKAKDGDAGIRKTLP